MTAKLIKPAQGRILISEPSLQDFYFRKSVVLLAEHNERGTFGLIINKPVNMRLNEITKDLGDKDFPLFLGGPVSTNSLYFIHRLGERIPKSEEIMDGLFWGGDVEVVKRLIQNNEVKNNDIRFFVGYSGWDPSQLDRELSEKSWVVSKATLDQLIPQNPDALWRELIRSLGGDYKIWSNLPSDIILN